MTFVIHHQGFLEHMQQLNVLPVLSNNTKASHQQYLKDLVTLINNKSGYSDHTPHSSEHALVSNFITKIIISKRSTSK